MVRLTSVKNVNWSSNYLEEEEATDIKFNCDAKVEKHHK